MRTYELSEMVGFSALFFVFGFFACLFLCMTCSENHQRIINNNLGYYNSTNGNFQFKTIQEIKEGK